MYIPTKKFYSTNVLVKDYTTNTTRMPLFCCILRVFILSLLDRSILSLSNFLKNEQGRINTLMTVIRP